jgi:23S rRNA (adenine2503-C2)-methyltransferase
MKEIKRRVFSNGVVYALQTEDNYPVEVTDTFLPFYTKDAIEQKQNTLIENNVSDRSERWMIGVSCMSGCPVRCKFCATGKLKKWRNLSASEIVEQVDFVLSMNADRDFLKSKEHKINYTRMGEPFLNIEEVRKAIQIIEARFPGTHHYVSTIGINGSDFSWIRDNITLQVSVHSFDVNRRNWLIPFQNKLSHDELGKIRTESSNKTTVNLSLIKEEDFDIEKLRYFFDPKYFFIKLSPINSNFCSEFYEMGTGAVQGVNLL